MAERIALQKKLSELGYPVRNFTGHFDFDLRDAMREVQVKFAKVPDGHPTPALLERWRPGEIRPRVHSRLSPILPPTSARRSRERIFTRDLYH